MERYRLTLDYDGTNYAGWQVQPDAVSVQGTITDVLLKLSGYPSNDIELVGCGRTDAGVHARAYVAHVDLPLAEEWASDQMMHKLNRMLPSDIAITDLQTVDEQFHARYSAVSRSYEYHLHTKKDVFANRYSTEYPYRSTDLSIERLNAATSMLIGEHDFTAFCKTGGDVKHHRCTVTKAEWEQTSECSFVLHISANRFLRGMIRLVVGMCCNVSRGKLNIDQVAKALHGAHRLSLDWSMPPQGLVLTDIKY